MDSGRIVVRIPATSFMDVIGRVEDIGEVTDKEISGDDVTDTLTDLDIRLKSSEKILDRLLVLLDRTEKMDDAIQVEKEIARVTETIEYLKGQMRRMKDQVAFSTLEVFLNASIPQKIAVQRIPFQWVRDLGEEFVRQREIDFRKPKWGKGICFELPSGFAVFDQSRQVTRALSAEGLLIKVSRHDNVAGGDLSFWTALIRRSLLENRGIKVNDIREVELRDGGLSTIVAGVRGIDDRAYRYMVATAVSGNKVFTYEAWGKASDVAEKLSDLEASIKTIKIKSFWQRLF